MTQRLRRIRLAFAASAAMLIALPALAQTVDELVLLIQQNIEGIQLETRVDPTRAEENLARQREQLDALRSKAPDHPMLSSLERRIDELGDAITAARATQSEGAVEAPFVPITVPADVRMQLREVEELQTLGDRAMMRGRIDRAVEHLDESGALIQTIENAYRDQIPRGYAPLIIAKERLAALRDQLGRQRDH